jgi:hypothetical protein
MGFFPGASPNRSASLPTFHHSLVPARIVHPPHNPPESTSLTYTLDTPTHPRRDCVVDELRAEVPNTHFIHHATPLYRFTLCGRRDPGCVPWVGNTVMVGVGQVKVVHGAGQRYRRYVLRCQRVRRVADRVVVGSLYCGMLRSLSSISPSDLSLGGVRLLLPNVASASQI